MTRPRCDNLSGNRTWRVGQMVTTPLFQGGNAGSIPTRVITYPPRAGKESGFRMAITGLPIHPSVVWAEVSQVSQLAIPFVGDTT